MNAGGPGPSGHPAPSRGPVGPFGDPQGPSGAPSADGTAPDPHTGPGGHAYTGPRGDQNTGPLAGPPLLIACALGIERLALRAGARHEAVTLLRTGMGPRAAEQAVRRALGTPALAHAAVVATGFCAGLAPGMHPGDLVVADETRDARDPDGITPCVGTGTLAEALRRALPGHTVHTGPLTGSDHVVRGAERTLLYATGAIAVDMESAATLLSAVRAGPRAVAAVRVVVDAPEHELVRIGTVRGGISAFRVLRAVLPAVHEWHRSLLLPRR